MRAHTRFEAHLRIATVIALGTTLLFGACPAMADDASGAGMRVYRDPATGKFTEPPPGASPPPAAGSLATSAQGLVETPGTSPAGGVTINLGGRFQSAVSARVDEAGAMHTDCQHSDAPTHKAK